MSPCSLTGKATVFFCGEETVSWWFDATQGRTFWRKQL